MTILVKNGVRYYLPLVAAFKSHDWMLDGTWGDFDDLEVLDTLPEINSVMAFL